MIAMRRGETAQMIEVTRIKIGIETLWTNRPVAMLSITPTITLGRKRMEASRADNFCTCWKLRCLQCMFYNKWSRV